LAATLGVVAAAACWGISAIMAKVAFEHGLPPDRMAQARAAVALLALAPVLALPFFLAVAAVRVVSAATAGIAATFEPVFAAGFAWLLLGQRLEPVQLAGGLLVVVGVVLAQLAQPRLRPDGEPSHPAPADLPA